MFRTVFVTFWILHVEFSASVPQNRNVAIQSDASSDPHPFITGVKFIPFKTTLAENVPAKFDPIPQIGEPLSLNLQPPINNAPDQSIPPKAQDLLPLNPLPSEIFDKFSLLPIFEVKKHPASNQNSISVASSIKNSADSSSFISAADLESTDNSNTAKLTAAVKIPPINVAELSNMVTNDAVKFISVENPSPVQVGELKKIDIGDPVKFISTAVLPSLPFVNEQEPQSATASESNNALPFPNIVFDPKFAVSRKLQPPEPYSFILEEIKPAQLIERNTPPTKPSPAVIPQLKSAVPIAPNLPADVKLTPTILGKPSSAAVSLPTELQPGKGENTAELVGIVSTNGYGILASQGVAVLNESTIKNLPLVFQHPSEPRKSKDYSPKKDVEVFAPLMPGNPAQPPQPELPGFPPQYPFPSNGGAYPNPYEPPFVLNEYPAYPPFYPEEQPNVKPFVPHLQPLLPPTRSTEETTRATEETTRATEETTPRRSKTTTTVPKFTPWVPKNTPSMSKNAPSVPKNSPSVPKNRQFLPRYTSPQQPDYPPDTHTWTTRFYPGYPTTKVPKGMLSPIWPMFTPQPLVNPLQRSDSSDMVTPYMEKLISATSTAAPAVTPSVQVLGEPSPVEPKYKLAVVSDYKNYDHEDGTFGFSIDLENGLTAKVRGYKKDGKHFIEGSYSLFANEGDPVNITYIADNEAPAVNQAVQPQTTNVFTSDDSATTSNTGS